MLLAPGDGAAFSFLVTEKGPVGVGARANPDVVRCRLYTESGHPIGEGVVQLHDLEPGRYLLVAWVPEDASPAVVQPAVVGLEKPSSDLPTRSSELSTVRRWTMKKLWWVLLIALLTASAIPAQVPPSGTLVRPAGAKPKRSSSRTVSCAAGTR